MNHVNLSQAKTEIVKQIGYFPAFLIPSIESSAIYSSLVKQTLFSYINNLLPARFKEKLFIILSRYVGISYFTICHSCTLHSQGVSAKEILALEKIKFPQYNKAAAAELEFLSNIWQERWQDNLKIEASLLRCAGFIFCCPSQTATFGNRLKDLLGTVHYHYLIVLLGYIKLCHQWAIANPTISHQKDRRSQMYLGSLLLKEIELAKFFQPKVKLTRSPNVSLKSPTVNNSQLSREFAACLDNAPFPAMIHDRQGKILYLNQNWLDVTGYRRSQISTIGEWKRKAIAKQQKTVELPIAVSQSLNSKCSIQSINRASETTTKLQQIFTCWIELDSGTDPDKAKNRFSDAVKSEVTVATNSGERRFWELYTAPLNYDNGDRLTISIAKNITDVIHYQTKLAEVEDRLKLVSEATKTGYWTWNLTTNQVDVCKYGRTLLGLENFDGSYTAFLRSIHPSERESIDLEAARAIQAHRDLNLQYRVVKSDGEIVDICNSGKLNYNAKGQPIGIFGVITDITKNRAKRDKFQTNQHLSKNLPTHNDSFGQQPLQFGEELKTIFNLLPHYLFIVELKTETILLINSGLAKSLCLPDPEAAMGKAIAEFAPEYALRIAEQHRQVIVNEQVQRVRQKVTLPDGIHYFDTVITPLRDRDGQIYALLHTSTDVSDIANTEAALSQRTIQLEAANRELESFSYSVSHDLQAPLRIINGFTQVLWENYHSNLDDRGKHYLQRIQANSQQMSGSIDALLQLSRVTRSQMESVDVNLSAIALDIVGEFQAENPERQVEVKIAPDVRAKGDPQLLRIVLDNLLNNAWKYTSKQSYSKIEFSAIANSSQQVTYYLRDNGAGFDQQYADRLFTPFQRLHSLAEFPGTGIGLATVQRIIYRHGGRVWAEGESDRGATIYFSL